MIGVEVIGMIIARRFKVPLLKLRGRQMLHLHRMALFLVGLVADAARTASIGEMAIMIHLMFANDGAIDVRGANDPLIHADDGRVVLKAMFMPPTSDEADAHITKAIIHATVVANFRAPVTWMEDINASILPAPIWRSPKRALIGSRHPGSWHPVIPIFTVSPIARRPDQVRLGAWRLFIDRQNWRRKSDADVYARVRLRRGDEWKKQRQQQPTYGSKYSH